MIRIYYTLKPCQNTSTWRLKLVGLDGSVVKCCKVLLNVVKCCYIL